MASSLLRMPVAWSVASTAPSRVAAFDASRSRAAKRVFTSPVLSARPAGNVVPLTPGRSMARWKSSAFINPSRQHSRSTPRSAASVRLAVAGVITSASFVRISAVRS